jgi:hypothetical protein
LTLCHTGSGFGSVILCPNGCLQQIAANRFSTPQDVIAILLQGFVRHAEVFSMRLDVLLKQRPHILRIEGRVQSPKAVVVYATPLRHAVAPILRVEVRGITIEKIHGRAKGIRGPFCPNLAIRIDEQVIRRAFGKVTLKQELKAAVVDDSLDAEDHDERLQLDGKLFQIASASRELGKCEIRCSFE